MNLTGEISGVSGDLRDRLLALAEATPRCLEVEFSASTVRGAVRRCVEAFVSQERFKYRPPGLDETIFVVVALEHDDRNLTTRVTLREAR